MSKVEELKYVNTPLDAGDLAEFERVKAYHGIKTSADVIRFLIRQEARRIQTDSGPGSVKAILAGYLAGQVTAEEAITALTVNGELIPMR